MADIILLASMAKPSCTQKFGLSAVVSANISVDYREELDTSLDGMGISSGTSQKGDEADE